MPPAGCVNLVKPPGITSHEAVNRLRRLLDERRVGHGGTLDPAATGVLPLFVGPATRLSRFTQEGRKAYRAEVTFGIVTETFDADGAVVDRHSTAGLNRERVETALADFRGTIEQRPPRYSAVRVQGERLHRLARRGEAVDAPRRRVQISELRLLHWQNEPPAAWLHVTCSKGTYIRSLAHDLGQRLRCGAYLRFLVRLQAGPFRIERGRTLAELAREQERKGDASVLEPPLEAVRHLPRIALTADEAEAVANGVQPRPRGSDEGMAAAHGDAVALVFEERLMAVGRAVRPDQLRGPVFGGRPVDGDLAFRLECVLP